MTDFTQSTLTDLIVHYVGQKYVEEGVVCSAEPVNISDDTVYELLNTYFLKPFRGAEEFFSFSGENDDNPVFELAKKLFEGQTSLYDASVQLAHHLYENSEHPNIKAGEFYVAYFKDCVVDDELSDAIGLFKSENKETYLKVYQQNDQMEVGYENGININKLDKGCIIFNTEAEHGFKIAALDQTNKSQEAQFWKEQFLQVTPRQDDFYQTRQFMQMCRDFTREALPEEETTEKIDIMNKSADYFSNNEQFDQKDFQEQVLQRPEIIDAFENYQEQYAEEKAVETPEEFDIAPSAVNKMKKVYKSVIKLDKNFHIYVHGNRELIEKGYDEEKEMHFYKVYYENEE